jgi:hypothetical protein
MFASRPISRIVTLLALSATLGACGRELELKPRKVLTADELVQTFSVTAFATSEAARTATAAAAASAAGAASRTRLGLAHGQSATAAILAVEDLDGLGGASFITHGDEAEAAAATGVAVADDLGAHDCAVGRKHAGELGIIDGPGEIADVEFQGIPRDNWSVKL